jgi:hypothetical protein
LKKALEIGVYLIKPMWVNVNCRSRKAEMEEVNAAAKNHYKGWSRNCGCFSGASRCCISYKDSYDYVPAQMLLKKSTVGAGQHGGRNDLGIAQNKP